MIQKNLQSAILTTFMLLLFVPTASAKSAEDFIMDFHLWLSQDNVGSDLINSSADLSREKALEWSSEADFYKFELEYNPEYHFTFHFNAEDKPTEDFIGECCTNVETVEKNPAASSTIGDIYTTLRKFVREILTSEMALSLFENVYSDNADLTIFVTLENDAKGHLYWTMELTDLNLNNTYTIQRRADLNRAPLLITHKIQRGRNW
ncbi:MAG: hypothetical protein R3B71_03695 [Candidatus Gracilibacteria bacterium]